MAIGQPPWSQSAGFEAALTARANWAFRSANGVSGRPAVAETPFEELQALKPVPCSTASRKQDCLELPPPPQTAPDFKAVAI